LISKQAPSPQTTLLILLGASQWPDDPDEFLGSEAFKQAAEEIDKYFKVSFGIPPENILPLFDTDLDAIEIGKEIHKHLEKFRGSARDVIIYYVGHAKRTRKHNQLYLAIKDTQKNDPEGTSLKIESLAKSVQRQAGTLHRFYILDCCFAANALSDLQGPSETNLLHNTFEEVEYTTQGYAALFSSGMFSPSVILPDQTNTFFSKALLHVLLEGDSSSDKSLSLKNVCNKINSQLAALYDQYRPHTKVQSPPSAELYGENLANVPLFPNLAREGLRPDVDDLLSPIPKQFKRLRPQSVIVVSVLLILLLLGGTIYRTVTGHLTGNVSGKTAQANITATATSTLSVNLYEIYVSQYGIMFGFNAQHTRTNPYEHNLNLGTVQQLRQQWADPIPMGGAIDSSAPAVAHGLVYIGSLDGNLYAFDAAMKGPPKWMASTGKGDKIHSSPAVTNGLVYIVSDNGDLYAFDAITGQKKGVASVGDGSTSSPTVANGMIYVGSNNGDLYAFGAPIGGQSNWVPKWIDSTNLITRTGQRGIASAPAVFNGLVYVSSLDGSLYAFDAITKGPPKWVAPTGSYIDSSPAVANDLVYVGSQDGNLYAFDASTGKQRWSAPTGAIHNSSPAVANGLVYIGSWETHNLYAFNATSMHLMLPLVDNQSGLLLREMPSTLHQQWLMA
jgi:outer membrane protein assembly factor BamB